MKYRDSGLPQQSENLRKAFAKYVEKFDKSISIADEVQNNILPTAEVLSHYSKDNKCDVLAAHLLKTVREASSSSITLEDVKEEFNDDIQNLLIQIEMMGSDKDEIEFVSPRLKQLFLSQALAKVDNLENIFTSVDNGVFANGKLKIASKILAESKLVAERCIPSGLTDLDEAWNTSKDEAATLIKNKKRRLNYSSKDPKAVASV